ncbi:MAG: hypothetical protein JSU04_12665 [Bdellovibrionales bacterium]|nr:hypothetical protein [Bdellovibrionales bacterium]
MTTALIVLLNMAFAATPVDGSYLRSCYTVNDDDTLQSVIDIQADKWTQTHVAFEDSACKTPYLIYQIEYNVKVGDHDLDLAMARASYTPLSDEVSEALNMIAYCGFTTWKSHEKKNVTGLLCDEFQVPKASEVLYSNFKLQMNPDQSVALYLGASAQGEDGKSVSARYRGTESVPYLKLQP